MSRMEKIREMLNQQPNDSFLLHALALEHIKIGQDSEALHCFNQLLGHNPAYLGSYYHLAKLHERSGNMQQAASTYEKGIQLAKETGDRHALNELQIALDDIID